MSSNKDFYGYTTLGDFLYSFRKDPEYLSKTLYLYRKILFGEVEFRILKNDTLSETLSFKECFKKFMSQIKKRGGIFLDTISPQIMPRKNNEYKAVTSNIYGELLCSSMCDDEDEINWKFMLPFDKDKIFTLDELRIVPPISCLYSSQNIREELCSLDINAFEGYHALDNFSFTAGSLEFCKFEIPTQKIIKKPDNAFDENRKMAVPGNPSGKVLDLDLDGKCSLGFIVVNDKKLIISNFISYPYDSCFEIYFNYINDLCLVNNAKISNSSILFYIFFLSNLVNFDIEDSLCDFGMQKTITLQNRFLYKKLQVASSRATSPYPSTRTDVIDFFCKLYFSKADIANSLKQFSNSEYARVVEEGELYEIIFEKKSRVSKKIIPDGIFTSDIIAYMVYTGCRNNTQNDEEVYENVKLCLAAIALQYPRPDDKVEKTLKRFFPEEFLNKKVKSNAVAQNIQRRIESYLNTNKEDIKRCSHPFYSEKNQRTIQDSIAQLDRGEGITKTMKELEDMVKP